MALAQQFKGKIIPVEEVADIFVREMSWRERKAFEARVGIDKPGAESGNLDNFPERLVLLTACDKDGTLVFDAEDLDAVLDLPTSTFWSLFKASQSINAISDSNVETARKN